MQFCSRVVTPAAVAFLFSLPLISGCSSRLAGGGEAVAGVQPSGDTTGSRGRQSASAPTPAPVVDTAWTVAMAVTGREVKCQNGKAKIFDCQNADLLSFLPVNAIGGGKLSGIWGWIDSATKREFAIVGRSNGTAFVEVTDPVNPKYLGNLPIHQGARPAIWHDMKVYKNHAFIVSDAAGPHGMQVFDLTQLRTVKNAPVEFQETAHYDKVASVHTIIMNEATGIAYNAGSNGGGESCGGGLHMVDVRTPTTPTFLGCYAEAQTGRSGTGYVHDAQCLVYNGPDKDYKGKEICLNSAETALSIADVTDKQNPKTISIATYPNVRYTHQGWFTDDQRYFFIDDELDDAADGIAKTRTIVLDLNDLDDPVVLTEFHGTTAATDHNLYIRGRYMYQSNYTAGLRIIDVSDPKSPKEIGYFDTHPDGGINKAGFSGGTWSNYPYFKNGMVAVTSMAEGLFMIRHPAAAATR
jgi:choice-of-anchor B domain-containing protein